MRMTTSTPLKDILKILGDEGARFARDKSAKSVRTTRGVPAPNRFSAMGPPISIGR